MTTIAQWEAFTEATLTGDAGSEEDGPGARRADTPHRTRPACQAPQAQPAPHRRGAGRERDTVSAVVSWWAYVLRYEAREGWRALPGPWPVKVLLIAILAAGQLIPGEVDEVLMLAAIGWVKRRLDQRRELAG